jgi:hypothetical protein
LVENKEIVTSDIRTNTIKQELYPYIYNNGIHALTNTSTGSLYASNGLAQLYKYLDIEAENIVTGWTPAPEDVGLSTDVVQHFLFHIQEYIFDNYATLVSKYGGNNANNYDKCLALLNQSETYIYLDYEAYYDNKSEHKVLKDKLLPNLFYKDKEEKLCYDYSISIGELDKVDMYIHQFYLSIIPDIDYITVGSSFEAEMLIKEEEV